MEQNGILPLGNYKSVMFESGEIKYLKSGEVTYYGNTIFKSYEIKVRMACFITER